MNYIISIDDTDMPGTKGTGWLVQVLCERLSADYHAECSSISRHQLFVHDDVPYTSHNSSMCFEISVEADRIASIIDYMAGYLEENAESGSDPGLCVAPVSKELACGRLIDFGRQAKICVLSKSAAYDLARKAHIHLTEHGGTGDGVIGALAGVGLRLSGEDGRYRGWYHLGRPGDSISVKTLCGYDFVDRLETRSGTPLPMDAAVQIGSEKTKTVRKGGRQVIVVVKVTNPSDSSPYYRTITKEEAKQY